MFQILLTFVLLTNPSVANKAAAFELTWLKMTFFFSTTPSPELNSSKSFSFEISDVLF